MSSIAELLGQVPFWIAVIAVAFIALCLALLRELLVRTRLTLMIREAALGGAIGKPPRQSLLRRRIVWLEKTAARSDVRIFEVLDVSGAFLSDFKTRRSPGSLRRLLMAYPVAGVVECFRTALGKPKLREEFRKYLAGDEASFKLTSLAMANAGVAFDGKAAKVLFDGFEGHIRELCGNPEWSVRFFAAMVLVEDNDPVSERLLWDFLRDPSSSIRKLAIFGFRTGDADRLFAELMDIFLRDPHLGVRSVAKTRIMKDFPDRYRIDFSVLGQIETLHVLELLESASKDDENAALIALDRGDLERRLLAARFLERTGTLKRLYEEADFGERERLEKTRERLEHAAEVNVSGFLANAQNETRAASLYLDLAVLEHKGDRSIIAEVAKHAFKISGPRPDIPELVDLRLAALRCVKARGPWDAAEVVAGELKNSRDRPDSLALILNELPSDFDTVFAPILLDFIEDPEVEPEEAIRNALVSIDRAMVLPRVLDIIKGVKGNFSERSRVRALKLLCALRVPYAVQFVVEYLADLPAADIPEFAKLVCDLDEKIWNERISYVLASSDSRLRAAVVRALPATGGKGFMKEIREALSDADPDLRLAAAASLAEMEDQKTLNTTGLDLLRDPVERVRMGTARILGKVGSEAVIEALGKSIQDPNESEAVVLAAYEGLGVSPIEASCDVLAKIAEAGEDMAYLDSCISAISRKTERKTLARLIENFKDAGPAARAVISKAFKLMGEGGEKALMDLLSLEIETLKPYIREALEASGFVDARIAKLAHRDPGIRREAAKDLSLVASAKAFKGIVLASRDPDPEIRVIVTKALDFLDSKEGLPILESLKADPDKRVRRYTSWAMERHAARKAI